MFFGIKKAQSVSFSACLLQKKKRTPSFEEVQYTRFHSTFTRVAMRPLFSMHDNDCRRTRLPANALTRPLRNALRQDLLPELLSAGDSFSLTVPYTVTLSVQSLYRIEYNIC